MPVYHPDVEQGHISWFKQRMGKVTASELGNLVTNDFSPRTGKMPNSYMCEKLAELWRGKPLIQTGSWQTEQGQVREENAIPFFQIAFNVRIKYCGFIETDDGRMGCSPDGLIGEGLGIEIKCPEPQTHVKYLMAGDVPEDYLPQVHGSMFVTGFKEWIFFSYQVGFPPLIVTVKRDDQIIAKIANALDAFHDKFEKSKAKLAEINDAFGRKKKEL
jgi:hypothetical protein